MSPEIKKFCQSNRSVFSACNVILELTYSASVRSGTRQTQLWASCKCANYIKTAKYVS